MQAIIDSKFNKVVRDYGKKLRAKWRKVVTGDENIRIRDHIINHQEEPSYVKFFDKVAFTLGVLNIIFCQYFLLSQPSHFWLWYSCIIPLLLVSRLHSFTKKTMQYFLLDFCYFSIICSLLCVFLFKDSGWFFKMCFTFANGPVSWAIVVWRCSLVYHDNEKMTSVYIHIFPAMLFYTLRWHSARRATKFNYTLLDMCITIIGYLFWQILYYVKTEIMDKEKLDKNPSLHTSLRWLASDTKNATAIQTLKLCRKLGIMKADENFDSYSFKTKAIFMFTQFIYTCGTILPVPLLYHSSGLHVLYLLYIFTIAVYNGGEYYIEVFSARYQLQFEKQRQIQRVARVAAEVAYEVATERIVRSSRASSVSMSGGNLSDLQPPKPGTGLREDGLSLHKQTREGNVEDIIARATSTAQSYGYFSQDEEEVKEGGERNKEVTEAGDRAGVDIQSEVILDDAGVSSGGGEWLVENDRNIIHTATTRFVADLMRMEEEQQQQKSENSDDIFLGGVYSGHIIMTPSDDQNAETCEGGYLHTQDPSSSSYDYVERTEASDSEEDNDAAHVHIDGVPRSEDLHLKED